MKVNINKKDRKNKLILKNDKALLPVVDYQKHYQGIESRDRNRYNVYDMIKKTKDFPKLRTYQTEKAIFRNQLQERIYNYEEEDRLAFIKHNVAELYDNISNQLKKDIIATRKKRQFIVVKIFISDKRDGDIRTSNILLKDYYNFNIEVLCQKILKKMIKIVDSMIYENWVLAFSIFQIMTPFKGGCNIKHKTKEYYKNVGDIYYNVISPTSEENNCLIECLKYITGINELSNDIRKKLNIDKGTLIDENGVKLLSDYFQISINIYQNISTFQKTATIGNYEDECDILNVNNHYVLLRGEKQINHCDKCGQPYKSNHTCNQSNINFFKSHINQKSIPIPKKNVNKTKNLNFDDMIYFDIETFINKQSVAEAYACGWYNKEYKVEDGEGCMEKFLDDILNEKDKFICAYNGCRFDFHFLLKILLDRNTPIEQFLISNNRIIGLKFGDNLKLFDLCLFTNDKLSNVCRDFKLKVQKGDFDHKKMTGFSDCITHREEYLAYLKLDVMSLKELFETFQNIMYETFKIHLTDFITLSQLAYTLFCSMLKRDDIPLPDMDRYNFIKKTIYGGRTYPRQKKYKSKYFDDLYIKIKDDVKQLEKLDDEEDVEQIKILKDKIKEVVMPLYNNIDDYIHNGDVTSLYPTAMKFNRYPVGQCNFIEHERYELKDLKSFKMGYYEIDYITNKKLFDPILPCHKEEGGLEWSLIDGHGYYNSVDIENAFEMGYKIFIKKSLVYDEIGEYIFVDYIDRTFKIKEENKKTNPALSAIGKLLLNGLYGKMLQSAHFDGSKMCNDMDEFLGFLDDHEYNDHKIIGEKILITGSKKQMYKNACITKPAQFGSFILGYSRRKMLDVFRSIDSTMENQIFTYTDTDSLHIHCSKIQKLHDKGMIYPKGLGQISNDCKEEGKILFEVNLAPKLYMYYYINQLGEFKTVMKSKGIPYHTLFEELFLNETPTTLHFTNNFKKVSTRKIDIRDKEKNIITDRNELENFDIVKVEMERTFLKSDWQGMSLEDNIFYCFNE